MPGGTAITTRYRYLLHSGKVLQPLVSSPALADADPGQLNPDPHFLRQEAGAESGPGSSMF